MNYSSDSEGRPLRLTFSFGRNWRSFSRFVSEAVLSAARGDIIDWLGPNGVSGQTVIDIGCGSGIHSFGFFTLGASKLVSLDLDRQSVDCTRRFWSTASKPANWRVEEANILDRERMVELGKFDIVYSWGVLHHTGRLWDALASASSLANDCGSRLWVSLYAKGPSYEHILKVKRRFNRWPWVLKQAYVWRYLWRDWRHARKKGMKTMDWFGHERGMNAYHDAVDWFGGLPYEESSVEEVTSFLAARGWTTERVEERGEGACSIYLFRR